MTATTEMTEFTASDWEGFAGAEAWPNSQPLIGYAGEYVIVAGRNGIDVVRAGAETENYGLMLKGMSPAMARLISNTILRAISETGMFDARGLGFISF